MSYFNKSSQKVNEVYKTNDLSIFNQMKGNRPPNPQHIRRLCASIKQHGVLQNPIIVNEKMNVIDGQHRLLAAREAGVGVYYIVVKGYNLNEIQVLNLNQKNWTKKDFMDGYADMGIEPYIKLRNFMRKNKEFTITNSIALCSNTLTASTTSISQKYRKSNNTDLNLSEVFEEGTWKGKNFELAQENAEKIKMIKPYYSGYTRNTFVSCLLGLFRNENFNFIEFLQKLKIQPNKLEDCTSIGQYKLLIEDIYNYRRREKVNLRF